MEKRKYMMPLIMLAVFETIAVTLWLTKDNLFYLFNFSYIGISISLGMFLFIREYPYARRIVQLLVGLYMLIYLANCQKVRDRLRALQGKGKGSLHDFLQGIG